ncbi:MAG: transposase [Candidatus Saccharicenans sp.]|nr:transposase [Candidatus Saccharicenans sp.]
MEKIAGWLHSGFSVHSKVRAETRQEAERIGKYMIRPLLSLERLSLDEREGKVCYQYGKSPEEVECMDYLEFIARVTSHIPDKGQVTVRYYGLYGNAHRGKVRQAGATSKLLLIEEECPRVPRRGWAEMIRKVYEVDPLTCPQGGGQMRIISFLTDHEVVDRIIAHLKLTFIAERPPPPPQVWQEFFLDSEAPADYFS